MVDAAAETKVVLAVRFGGSHIDGLFIIPPALAVSPPGPVGVPQCSAN